MYTVIIIAVSTHHHACDTASKIRITDYKHDELITPTFWTSSIWVHNPQQLHFINHSSVKIPHETGVLAPLEKHADIVINQSPCNLSDSQTAKYSGMGSVVAQILPAAR